MSFAAGYSIMVCWIAGLLVGVLDGHSKIRILYATKKVIVIKVVVDNLRMRKMTSIMTNLIYEWIQVSEGN